MKAHSNGREFSINSNGSGGSTGTLDRPKKPIIDDWFTNVFNEENYTGNSSISEMVQKHGTPWTEEDKDSFFKLVKKDGANVVKLDLS